ncbi:MAG: S8 family serine peptidase [Lachnospiraceae bacterium]|nr:S8 family serine peptidase [Lachnospiraceae bacterium]
MKRRLMKLTAMLLAFAMTFGTDASLIAAAPAIEEASMPEEEPAAENTGDEFETDKNVESPEDNAAADEDAEAPEEDALEAPDDDNDSFFYRALSEEEEEAKEAAEADEKQVMEATEGEDYAAGEVIALCDTEEEAKKIADGYAKSTGYNVVVDSFGYGVAVLKIYGKPDEDKLIKNAGTAGIDSVEAFVKIGADRSNNLPAVYPNFERHTYSVDTDNEDFSDPFLKNKKTDGSEQDKYQWYHELINDKFVWKNYESDASFRSSLSQIEVAVLDTGINYEHNDLSAVVGSHQNFVDSEYYPNDPNEIYNYTSTPEEKAGGDTQGHGTNVSGIIGNIANSIGGRGVAAGVKIDSYRVLGRWGSSNDDSVLRGLRAAVDDKINGGKNIRVINMSLGGAPYSGAFERPLSDAKENGILVVAAAGNENTYAKSYPAAYDDVMSVAALNSKYEKSSFSNYGDWVDISAPGGDYRTEPNVPGFAVEEELWASGPKDSESAIIDEDDQGNRYTPMAGTSQATPVVAGCAALLFALHPDYTPDQIEGILEGTARHLESDYELGYGCVDIAEAMDMNISVPSPVVNVEPGQVMPGTDAELSIPAFGKKNYATIKYTLNGKIPCDPDTPMDEVYTFKNGDAIEISDESGKGDFVIVAQTLVYGFASEPATFEYSFDRTLKGLSIIAPGGADHADVAEDSTIKLQATITPTYVEDPEVTWSVDDSYIAAIDENGILKGLNRGQTLVRAKVAGTETTMEVFVTAPAEQVIFKKDIELEEGAYYELNDDDVKIYPLDQATDLYTLTSSNPRVLRVERDADGDYIILADSIGTSVLTATAADGTGMSDTVSVTVTKEITSIDIYDTDGYNMLTSKKDLIPGVIYNGDAQGEPTDDGLTWIIESGEEYAEFVQGRLKAKGNYPYSHLLTIYAEKNGVESNRLSVTLYSLTKANDIWSSSGTWPTLDSPMALYNLFGFDYSYPYHSYSVFHKLKYDCSSTEVKIDPDRGVVYFEKEGKYSITAETVDGSKVKKTSTVTVISGYPSPMGIQGKTGELAICPGGTVSMEVIMSRKGNIPSDYKFGLVTDEKHPEYEFLSKYYTKDDYLSVSGNNVTGVKNKMLETVEPGTEHIISWGRVYSLGSAKYCSVMYNAPIEMYPAATARIDLSFEGEPYVAGMKIHLEPGDSGLLGAKSYPDNACQKYYTFKSGNTKVATVDEKGKINAVGNGKTTVTVTAGDGSKKTAKMDIEVAKLAGSVEISSKTGAFNASPGKTLNLIATVKPDDTVNKKVKWSVVEGPATIGESNGTLKINSNAGIGTVKVKAEVINDGNVTATGSADISIKPETTSITVDDDVKKSGLTVFTHKAGSCHKTTEFSVKVTSKINGQTAAEPSVTSSDSSIVAIEKIEGNPDNPNPAVDGNVSTYTYKVTAKGTKAGSATINATATDGSNKKVSVKVALLVPVTELTAEAKDGISTVTPGKSITIVATANKDASNKKIEFGFADGVDEEAVKNLGIDVVNFKKTGKISMSRTATGNDTFRVIAKATDGSGTQSEQDECMVTVKPAQMNSIGLFDGETKVTSASLGLFKEEGDERRPDDDPFKVIREFDIKTTGNGEYQKIPIVTSSDEQIVKAVISNDGKKLCIYTYDVVSRDRTTKTGKATVTLKAADGSNKSAKLTVNVAEPVRDIYISADKSTRCIAANGKIKMKATVSADASDKKVNWKLVEDNANGQAITKDVATISASGDLKPDSKLKTKTVIKVVATPADGATYYTGEGFEAVSASETITLYPAQGAITFNKGTDSIKNLNLAVNEEAEISIMGAENSFKDYLVTYQTGPIKVNYTVKGENGTSIKIKGLTKGTSTITAAARDGSGKKVTLKVTVK